MAPQLQYPGRKMRPFRGHLEIPSGVHETHSANGKRELGYREIVDRVSECRFGSKLGILSPIPLWTIPLRSRFPDALFSLPRVGRDTSSARGAASKPRSLRRGLTLIELVIVIAVIVILAGFLIAGAAALGIGSDKQRTATIIETVRSALEQTRIQQGSTPSPAEHPLAGSHGAPGAPRFVFQRAGGGLLDSPDATETLALRGVELANLTAADQPRLLLDDDLYADGRVPALYGLRREFIGVLGHAAAGDGTDGVVRYRDLPAQRDVSPTPVIADPDDTVSFPDEKHLNPPPGSAGGSSKRILDSVLGHSGAKAELTKLGALKEPGGGGTLVAYGRVWSPVEDVADGETEWEPRHLRDPEDPDFVGGPHSGDPRWIPYRIDGLAIHDVWGTELLFSYSDRGKFRLLSAGPDGCFRFHPGEDDAFQTAANASEPSGDDRDARRDNITSIEGIDL